MCKNKEKVVIESGLTEEELKQSDTNIYNYLGLLPKPEGTITQSLFKIAKIYADYKLKSKKIIVEE
ncbi:MAG: hypothetical protein UR39_C0006G0048 [Candidatus Woesebacteria bacterium GW2011_GWA1_33_30]|uniref:Uncharacterized protein n=1 Tax=Candidatus Woesebacteria bacterium GW2011_GWA2_33_28 TaxID=1618561 RepID=A0A0F9ZRX5_9BACT|nr:MAG: hypothetical protein UR38_C0006G0006 [Candidatus Woesebacteria bacterium GW2011_GWA2_33_28]KKP47892.1 MAG: hypothetical protein UR39_C0006G0048 [Candidatus Woesebacteria bacterium GW2011_GWA1_33_30]KKP49334.1 MAG: hypothetical protein UR40_C0007G0047 [Microgenomates group bacterium GW2011_GWC1_33_32]KKP52045.1 MAG: hypothetical protein UR44_C0005G0048 [Candidatus Woesebacteria bacterium GW2011_GWB1_33_38]KKP57314.1 MAG: hypothetical protein UR48_C0020G0010 [Microgenomates group bacteriu